MFKNTTKKVVNDAADEIREEVKKDIDDMKPFVEKAIVITILALVAVKIIGRQRTSVVNHIYILKEQPNTQLLYRGIIR